MTPIAGTPHAAVRRPRDPHGPSRVLEAPDIGRALTRIAHEILERNQGRRRPGPARHPDPRRRRSPAGSPPGSTRSRAAPVPVGSLDVTMYRDDLRLRPARALERTDAPAGRRRRPDRRPGRRRPLLRPHRPGRARRARRPRPAARGPAGRPGRPRPPRAADPGRLRRQEPADLAAESVRVLLEENDGEDACPSSRLPTATRARRVAR